MGRFVEGEDRQQDFLLPASLDDYVSEDNPVRVVEAFIDELDLHALGFAGAPRSDQFVQMVFHIVRHDSYLPVRKATVWIG